MPKQSKRQNAKTRSLTEKRLQRLAQKTPSNTPKAPSKSKRPRQSTGRKTKSDEELRQRYEAVAQAMLNGTTKFGELKRMFAEWDVSPQTMQVYTCRAREILAERLDFAKGSESRIEAVAEVADVYRRSMHGEKVPFRTQILAAKEFSNLFGLDAPFKVAPTKPDGDDAYMLAIDDMTEEELLLYLKMCEKAEKLSADQAVQKLPK